MAIKTTAQNLSVVLEKMEKLLEYLEDHDDVQEVFQNWAS